MTNYGPRRLYVGVSPQRVAAGPGIYLADPGKVMGYSISTKTFYLFIKLLFQGDLPEHHWAAPASRN